MLYKYFFVEFSVFFLQSHYIKRNRFNEILIQIFEKTFDNLSYITY